jgi:kynureninase
MTITRQACVLLDDGDTLRAFRDRFILPDGLIYLDGNSLGALPKATPARMRDVVEREWGEGLIRSWNACGWIDAQRRVGEKIGRLIGARPGETLVADSTSINLFKLLAAALKLRPGRKTILSEAANFPTDLYIAEGLIGLLGQGHRLVAVAAEDVAAAIDDDTAVVMLTHVNYRTGRMWDMRLLTELAQRRGALMLWDLAHSAGAMPIQLAVLDVDLAVGCGYKFLNGGPGAPAFLYVAARLQGSASVPLSGWFGHADPFAFEQAYRPAAGIARAAAGTPPLLSLAALEVGVDVMLAAPMDEVRRKSLAQTALFARLIEQEAAGHDFEIVSPREDDMRGSQVCLRHAQAWPIMQALIARGVIGDFRAPDILRFGFTPLYLGYADVWDAVAALRDVMVSVSWRDARYQSRLMVT